MSDLWGLEELASAVHGTLDPVDVGAVTAVSSISIDTRTLDVGALYVAIQGVALDGHKFVGAAFKAGAHAALVRADYQRGADEHGVLIRVADTLKALEDLGRAARSRIKGRVIAVTGSAGKTGTKAALDEMLSDQGVCHASVKSFNNHWGVPLSLARMPAGAQYGVFEVGMNHAGEIEPLSKMIRPNVALITTVAPVHIGHFANEEEIADAKAEIFVGLEPEGTAVLPMDNPHFQRLKAAALKAGVSNIVGFGQVPGVEARLIDGQFDSEGSAVKADILGQIVQFKIAMPGAHIALNLIGALASIKLVGGDVSAAAKIIPTLLPPEGRGVRQQLIVPGGEILLIDESYNANPASMDIALRNLSFIKGEDHTRRIAVLGDMLELGVGSQGYHKDLAPLISDLDIDLVYASGEMMAFMFEDLPVHKQGGYAPTSQELFQKMEQKLNSGDVLMIKGSLGSNMGNIVGALRDKFAIAE